MMRHQNFIIEQYCDGWAVYDADDGEKLASWNHNDTDMGVEGLERILKWLGHNVEIEEVY